MSVEKPSDVVALFHSMLEAYQISLRDILGSGKAVFVHPVLENFMKINEATGVHMVKGQSLDVALQNLSKTIKATGYVKDFRFEKLSAQKYLIHVDGCIWAPEVHKNLNPKDLTCSYALIGMAIIQAYSGSNAKCTHSEYLKKGTKTIIEITKPKKT
ncbi:MAG: hypothetical protein ACE5KD_01745 [Candidatus Bathyarchaeia archaeon]